MCNIIVIFEFSREYLMWHLSINVFGKKAPLELVFIVSFPVCWGAGPRILTEEWWDSSQGCSKHRWGSVTPHWTGRVGQGWWEGHIPTALIIRQKHGNRVSLGFTDKSSQQGTGQGAGTSMRWFQPKTGVESMSRAELPAARFPRREPQMQ